VVAKDSPTLLYRLLHDAAKIIFYMDKKKSAISISFLHYLPFFGNFIFPNGAHDTNLSRAVSPRRAGPRRSVIARGRCLGLRSVGER